MHRALALAFLIALAGCLESSGPAIEPQDTFIPFGDGHDHADADAHRIAHNATMLDLDDLQRFGANEELTVGAHALAIHENILAVAVNGNHDDEGGQQGFHLFDVSDPAHMVHLSYWDAGAPVRGDRTIAISPDGQTVFLGFESGPRPGIAAVDISDPADPHEVAFWADETGYGPHTVATGQVGGTQYVFALVFGVTILEWTGDSLDLAGRYITSDEGAILDAIDYVEVDPGNPGAAPGYARTYALRTLYGHDAWFYDDPELGPLLLVAFGYDGAKMLSLETPAAPVLLARFIPDKDTDHRPYVHAMTAERIDGRLIVVVGSETFEAPNQPNPSPIWVLDATEAAADRDPTSRMEPLSRWGNPDGAPAGALNLSVHFHRQQDGLLYLSHYHGGVWAFDLRTPESRKSMEPMAHILPVPEDPVPVPEECCIGWPLRSVPLIFDVEVDARGNVYAADLVQGVSSIRIG